MKWYFTSGGWWRVLIVVGLLVGAGFTDGVISMVMIIGGLALLVYGYIVTAINVRKINKQINRQVNEDEAKLKCDENDALDKELAEFFSFQALKDKRDTGIQGGNK